MKRNRVNYTGSFLHDPEVLPPDQEYGPGKPICEYLISKFHELGYESTLGITEILFCGWYTFIVRYQHWSISVSIGKVLDQDCYLVQVGPDVNETALWRQIFFPPLEELKAVATKLDGWLKEKEGINQLRWQDKRATRALDYSGGSANLVLIEYPEGVIPK